MEIPVVVPHIRTCDIIKRKTLKDGTIKEYKYKQSYTTKTNIVVCGKNELIKRIIDCKDKQKIEQLKQKCDELGI